MLYGNSARILPRIDGARQGQATIFPHYERNGGGAVSTRSGEGQAVLQIRLSVIVDRLYHLVDIRCLVVK